MKMSDIYFTLYYVILASTIVLGSNTTFFVARNIDQTTGTNLITFNVAPIKGAFNSNTSTFNVPSSGFYWLIITAGVPGSTQCEIRTRGVNQINELVRAHVSYTTSIDTLCREGLINLEKGEEIFLSSTYPLSSDGNLQTAFASFSVDETMSPVVAFQVASSTSQTTLSVLVFDSILIDTNNRWNTATNEYNVQIAGIYVLNFMTGINYRDDHTVRLTKNSEELTRIYFTVTTQGAEDLISRTVLTFANTNDRFFLELTAGTLYSDVRYYTSFSGFLYSPRSSPIAWYVATNSPSIIGPTDPVPFGDVIVNVNNVGSGWNSNTNRYIVPLAGVYHISICGGLYTGFYVNLLLLLNDDPVSNVQITGQNRNGYDVRGKSIIIRLKEGDELRLVINAGYRVYGSFRSTTFSGFRLHD